MQVELNVEARLEIAAMVYARWSDAFDTLKQTKTQEWDKTCPKSDWPEFHASRIRHAQHELDLCLRLKDAICKYSPLVTGELE